MSDKLRILMVHNYYQQPGGEDAVFSAEKALLKLNGHDVIEYIDTNHRLSTMNQFTAAGNTIWSASSYFHIKKLIEKTKPDIAHFHNTFLMISPSAYYPCQELGVPIVQTLHNYRLLCPVALLYRKGMLCEECVGKSFAWPGIRHRCFHDSRLQTGVVSVMLKTHHFLHTWRERVDIYIALSEFSREKFISGGFPKEKIVVKPNFVSQIHGYIHRPHGEYVLYLGRLSHEKGLVDLISAWENIESIPLIIVGDGPLRENVEGLALRSALVRYLGYQEQPLAQDLISHARFIIVPSVCYENFPMIIAEAFAYGVPVIASNLGVMKEIVRDGETGILFNTGNAQDLAAKVRWLWDRPEEAARMGQNARLEYEQKYSPEKNYQLLIGVYEKAMEMEGKS